MAFPQQICCLLIALLVFLSSIDGRPSSDGAKKSDKQGLSSLKDDLQWQADWWSPTGNKEENEKDSWKIFKTSKPGLQQRWWEEGWEEEDWWAPKDSVDKNKVIATDSNKTGENKTLLPHADDTQQNPVTESQPEGVNKKPATEPNDQLEENAHGDPVALPLVKEHEESLQVAALTVAPEAEIEKPDEALSETPKEKLDPSIFHYDTISPFEDPRLGPGSGPKDNEKWQYHHVNGGYGKIQDKLLDKPVEKTEKVSEEKMTGKKIAAKVSEETKLKITAEETKHKEGGTKDKDGETIDKDGETKDKDGETIDKDGETKDKDGETKDKDGETKDKDGETKDKDGETKGKDGETKDKDEETKDKDEETKDKDGETKDKEDFVAHMEKVEEEIQKEEENHVVKIAEEDKQKILDQFYGFGLEFSDPDTPPREMVDTRPSGKSNKTDKEQLAEQTNEGMKQTLAAQPLAMKNKVSEEKSRSAKEYLGPSEVKQLPVQDKKQTKEDKKHYVKGLAKDVPAYQQKENYNEGVIYDTIPGNALDKTHSVKKDFSISDYLKDFVNTKANLQTSPNPAPPGIANKKVDGGETTTFVQTTRAHQQTTASTERKEPAFYIKSHPLTHCKFDGECRSGRMCKDNICVCLPEDGCKGHFKPVCGSDGLKYTSHCELHRAACISGIHIKVDLSGNCFVKHDKVIEMQKIQQIQLQNHRLPSPNKVTKKSDSDEDEDKLDDYDDSEFTEKQHAWLNDEPPRNNTNKLVIDPHNIFEYTKDLKEESVPKLEDKDSKPVKTIQDPSPWEHVQEETGEELEAKGDNQTSTVEAAKPKAVECTLEELAKFKEQLLAFHCKRFEEPNCKLEVQEEREYLSTLMFSYLDKNTDYELDYKELDAKQKMDKFHDLNPVCSLTDLIWFDDTANADGQLSLDEFIAAFNKIPVTDGKVAKTTVSSPVIYIIPTLATVGNGLELKCGLFKNGTGSIWRRNGVNIRQLGLVELLVLEDGSLFFSKITVHHMGNYSCENPDEPSVLQIHTLKVQMPPIVKVSPHSQIEPAQIDVSVRCHAEGVPRPVISWQINNLDLPQEPKHYMTSDNNEVLTVHRTDFERDTGAYKCVAKNQAGTAEDISSLFVIGDKEKSMGMGYSEFNTGTFTVFHDQGYTAFNPDDCLKRRNVHGDFGYFKFIPDSLDGPLQMCEENKSCSWGGVINVKNNFVYVSQPSLNRVLVIETSKNWIPIQVISTDKRPMQLYYVEHLDQVWVLCWNGEEDESTKTIIVIRDASKFVQHRGVHTQPVGNHFDQIQELFIAPPNDLHVEHNYGFVTHNGQQGLTKLDLDNMRYFKTVDLTQYECVPHSLAFVPIGGHVIVQCVSLLNHQTLQLTLDYITDAVISSSVQAGRPYVSPDSRHVVTVDDFTGKVSVTGVSNEGVLEPAYEVTVSASISDVAFFSLTGHGYLLMLTSADDDDIISINLSTGKVDKMKGTRRVDASADWHPSPVKRTIVSGDVFSDFLMTPSKSSISILDVKFQKIQCEFSDTQGSGAMLFVGRQ